MLHGEAAGDSEFTSQKHNHIFLFFVCVSCFSKKGVYTTIKTNCTIYRGAIIALGKTREVTSDWFFCSPSHCECVSSVKTSSVPFSQGGISSGKPLWRAMEVDNWSGAGRSRKREAALTDDECRAFEPRRSSCARVVRGTTTVRSFNVGHPHAPANAHPDASTQ